MRTIPLDFPWRPGMRILPSPSSGDRYARVLAVADGIPTIVAVEMRIQLDSRVGPWIEAWSDDAGSGDDLPDEEDPPTIGALADAVREALGRQDVECHRGKGGYFLGDFAEGQSYTTMRTDGGFRRDDTPELCGATRWSTWLAAWNARPVEAHQREVG